MAQARALGDRRRDDGATAVFGSDLRRARDTADLAFASTGLPVLYDWRLRECDYGTLNGAARDLVLGDRRRPLDDPYPGGESWRQAVGRAAGFLTDVTTRWDGRRLIVIGHVATRYALEHHLGGRALEELLAEDFARQPGWEYELT